MTPGRNGRSHTTTVILVLALAALLVASLSAGVLWAVYRSKGKGGGTVRRDKPELINTGGTAPARGGRSTAPARGATGGPGEGRGRGANDGRGAGPAPVNCGDVQPWDADGDRISDSLEQSNRTFHAFDPAGCDRDPSSATGKPSSGALVRGVNLTDGGSGYVHLRGTDGPDTDDWATLRLLSCIEAVGRDAQALEVQLTVNDLSLRSGGLFVPHSSHQNGLDVDVRYVRLDGRVAPLDIRRNPGDYDAVTTQALLQAFVRRCQVSTIFADLPSLEFTNEELNSPVLVQAPGHTNHFHVRLRPSS